MIELFFVCFFTFVIGQFYEMLWRSAVRSSGPPKNPANPAKLFLNREPLCLKNRNF
jgi:hypothetical protein